jgi:hypothetical protein
MVTFKYNPKDKYLETFFIGKISPGEIIHFFNSLTKHNDLPMDLKILIDVSEGSLNINPADLNYILEENIKMFRTYNTLKIALVTTNPIDTALAVIYSRLIDLERYQFIVYCEMKTALQWLRKGTSTCKFYPKTILSYMPPRDHYHI